MGDVAEYRAMVQNHLWRTYGKPAHLCYNANAARKRRAAKAARAELSAQRRVQRKLRNTVSSRISRALKEGRFGLSLEQLVGYSAQQMRTHLEALFLPGMTWDNHGEWHIDHIRPLSSFEFTSRECAQFCAAWALDNLQPLWAADNLRKGARWEP